MTTRHFIRFHKILVTNRLQSLNFNLQIVSIKNLTNTVIIIFGPTKISVDSFFPYGKDSLSIFTPRVSHHSVVG